MADLFEGTLRALGKRLGDRVSRPGRNRYAAATAIWAKPVGPMPRAVVHCQTSHDVQLAASGKGQLMTQSGRQRARFRRLTPTVSPISKIVRSSPTSSGPA